MGDRAWIIDSAIDTIDGFEALLGLGIPISGDLFHNSSSRFTQIAEEQGSAAPGDNWMGTAAEKYSNRNELQHLREEIMADLDYITGTLVTEQADAVKKTRDVLSFGKNILEKVRPVAVVLSYIPLVGREISAVFQLAITTPVMAMVMGALAYLALKTAEDAAKLLAALWKLVELLEALIETEVIDFFSDIEYDIKEFLSKLETDLYSAWSEIAGLFSSSGSGLGGLSFLSSLTSLSRSGGSAGSAVAPDLTHLSGLASLSDPAHLGSGAGFPAMGNVSSSMSQMRALSAGVGSVGNVGQTGQFPELASSQAPAQTQSGGLSSPGALPHSAARRSREDGRNGAASGAVDADRAPVDAPAVTREKAQKQPISI
ncbi:hypothetical protein AWC15_21055 [Mycobacterium lacus]|uniref:Uncharacterized protein n=2 Tax=Mycobacterium lacus TaxID=169765 RepID=A0A1X1Y6T2_9MYCO|nr:hypothetical protein AWC15_21055 [Mycobacterium lacus]BBX96277.1 hypothetical protein MLAC_15710 [Mycobacterium lacus]